MGSPGRDDLRLLNNHAVQTERWRYIQYHDGGQELYDHGIAGIVCIADRPMNFDQSLRRTGELLEAAAHRAMRLIGVGRGMGG